MVLNVELAARILTLCSETRQSVTEVLRGVGGSHDNTIDQIRELKNRSLLHVEAAKARTIGRPRKYIHATPIGKQFVREYNHLCQLSIRSNENDLRKALRQAEATRELIERGISPYARQQELNQIARNIARTAKTQHSPR